MSLFGVEAGPAHIPSKGEDIDVTGARPANVADDPNVRRSGAAPVGPEGLRAALDG